MEHGAGQSVTAGAERDRRIETDPTTVRLSKQVDCEVDIGKHPLFRRFADCYSICCVDQPNKSCEVRHWPIVDQIDVGGHPGLASTRDGFATVADIQRRDVSARPHDSQAATGEAFRIR